MSKYISISSDIEDSIAYRNLKLQLRENNAGTLLGQYKLAYNKIADIIERLPYCQFKEYLPKTLDTDDLMLLATSYDINTMRLVLNDFEYQPNPHLHLRYWCYPGFTQNFHTNVIEIIKHGIKLDDSILFEAIFIGLHFNISFDDYLLLLSNYSDVEAKMEGLLWFTENMTQTYSKDVFYHNLQHLDLKTKDLYIERLKIECGPRPVSYNLMLHINGIDQPIDFNHWDIASLYQHLPGCLQEIIINMMQVNMHQLWLPFEIINIILLYSVYPNIY